MKKNTCILLIASMLTSSLFLALACGRNGPSAITQEELVQRTQSLVDSVARGDQGPCCPMDVLTANSQDLALHTMLWDAVALSDRPLTGTLSGVAI